jgi:carbonic anhydrase/acetyltransferase-like protein (isoleucine patch superfamily)
MPTIPFKTDSPQVTPTAFVAPDAWVIGRVTVGEYSSIFFNAVIRGDIQPISIGAYTNVQEHALLHTSYGMSPVVIGDYVTVGHRAIIHGCSVGNCSLIGMGATILDDAVIGEQSIVGAHALITKGTIIPPRSLVMGTPGKVVRPLTDAEVAELRRSAEGYVELGKQYRTYFSS